MLHWFTRGYQGLEEVRMGCKRLQGVTGSYKLLHRVKRG